MNKRFVFYKNKRRVPLIRFLLVIACLVFIFQFSRKEKTGAEFQCVSTSSELTSNDTLQCAKYSDTQKLIKISYRVKSGDTFYSIFPAFGFSQEFVEKMYRVLKKEGFTSIYPNDSIVICKNENNTLKYVHFFIKLFDKFSVFYEDTLLKAQKKTVPIDRQVCLVNGTLENSLSEAMFTHGVGDAVTFAVTDIFAWDINFFLDPRKGDTFQVVFEKKLVRGRTVGYGDVLAAKYVLKGSTSFSAVLFRNSDGENRYYDGEGKALQKQFLKAPLNYSRISSGFTYKRRHPILGIVRPHLGIDYAAPRGTPVVASADGKVLFAGRKGDYGNMVILGHGGVYQTYYGHLYRFTSKIARGRSVVQGQIIGRVGATGLATGPHLDYRMKKRGKFINPLTLKSPSLKSIDTYQQNEFAARVNEMKFIMNERFSNKTGCFVIEINRERISNEILAFNK